jgi:ELWxxDGT repeat protein
VEPLEYRITPSTSLVQDIFPGPFSSIPQALTNVNGTVFFAADDGTHGKELWKSDGTSSGTVLVKDINPGGNSSMPYTPYMANVNGTLFFSANDGHTGFELWKSDGTANGTVLVKNINPNVPYLPISSNPHNLTAVGNTLFFVATDGSTGFELWKSDGSADGTVLVKDILPGRPGSSPHYLTNVNGTLFFVATDGTSGEELWKSDGTTDGTVLVKDINSGAASSYPRYLTNVQGTLFFTANDGVNGNELWKSDGTTDGTVLVKDISVGRFGSYPVNLTAVNDTLFFGAADGVHGRELWKSDGTADGTVLVKDINTTGYASGIRYAQAWANVNSTLFFGASDGLHGDELWKSDGTAAGTVMVKDISPGEYNSSIPGNFTAFGNLLLFTATLQDRELWASDGTEAGTVLVKDLGGSSNYPFYLAPVGSQLFFTTNDGVHGQELWKATFPLAAVSGPSDGVRYQPRIFQFIGLDPAPIASFSIDWGDGSTQVMAGPSPALVAHAFTATGTYTVTMTTTDVSGSVSDPISQTITISVLEQQDTELAVGGTPGDDVLFVRKGTTKNTIEVILNHASLGSFANPSLFLFYGGDGNDQTTIAASGVATLQDGGAGNDVLQGGDSGNILIGGPGDDTLMGGLGRDILIGGTGADRLQGLEGDDLLIGGTTDFDANETALKAILAEWSRTDADYLTRVHHLDGSLAGGLNGPYFLNATTVHDDGAADRLFGTNGQDWFLVGSNDQTDQHNGEIVTTFGGTATKIETR